MTCEEYRKHWEERFDRSEIEEDLEVRGAWKQHAAECERCRLFTEDLLELDQRLRRTLAIVDLPKRIAAIEFATCERAIKSESRGLESPSLATSNNATLHWLSYAAIFLLVLGSSLWIARDFNGHRQTERDPSLELGVIENIIGEVLVQASGQSSWRTCSPAEPTVIQTDSRIRTANSAWCQITTRNGTSIRLNSNTECILHSQEEATIVQGTMWVRASTSSFAVKRGTWADSQPQRDPNRQESQASQLALFQCPSGAALQCESAPTHLTCYGLGQEPIRVQVANGTYVMPPSGKMLIRTDRNAASHEPEMPPTIPESEKITSTLWQLPLLGRSELDLRFLSEVIELIPDERVFQSKAFLGDLKLQMFVDSQIREMGPVAAKPLFAYVKSERSLGNPESRRRAMQLGAQLADGSCLEDLRRLGEDSDERIATMATAGIARLEFEGNPPKR